jgi:nucleoside-diphosphate-sugar epimerase
MKIVITGSTGSLGAAMVKYFSGKGHEVIATGRAVNPPEKLLACAKYLCIDINSPFELPEADFCIHTAALSDDKAAFNDLYQSNVIGTKNTLQAASKIKSFIHISSSSVYLPSGEKLPETVAGLQNNRQLSPYGKSKLMAENILKETTRHQSCFILRPRALYGPCDKVIMPRLLKLEKNQQLFIPGKMEVKISMTHYANLIQAIECCMRSTKTGIHTYNVADDTTYLLIEIIRKLTTALYGKQLPEKEIPIALLKAMAIFKINGMTNLLIRSFTRDMVLDTSKIKNELNYQPVIDFDSVMDELIRWINSIGGISVLKTGDTALAWK